MRKLGAYALVALVLIALSSLAPTVLFLPKVEGPGSQVFVIDHGTHSSIVIQTDAESFTRYAYGDLRYYANRDTSLESGAAALLWPTPATLGRGIITDVKSVQDLQEKIPVVIERIHALEVSTTVAEGLVEELEGVFTRGASELIAVPEYGLDFVPHPERYFWANNSSTTIANWLRQMDVGVLGWGLFASWSVAG